MICRVGRSSSSIIVPGNSIRRLDIRATRNYNSYAITKNWRSDGAIRRNADLQSNAGAGTLVRAFGIVSFGQSRRLFMLVLRKTLAWLVLASYLFANSLAASLHDHRECCGHSKKAEHLPSETCHTGHHHLGQNHAGHDHAGHKHISGGAPDHGCAGDELYAPHHCLVCEFFAQAPLTPPAADLIPGGDILPDPSAFSVLLLSHRAAGRHLPRGPPAQG